MGNYEEEVSMMTLDKIMDELVKKANELQKMIAENRRDLDKLLSYMGGARKGDTCE